MAEFYDGPHATPPPAEDGPVYLGIKNLSESGHLDLSTVRHIAESDFATWTRRVEPKPGDIVFTYEATLHRYAIIPEGFRGSLGRRIALIRPDESKIDRRYLHYYLLSSQWRRTLEQRINVGSTVDRIPLTEFPDYPVPLPPLPHQRAVVATLGGIDDLIENNRRRIEILEEMARLIYRKWFVHFRFPGHEDIEFVESDLGPIPEGWAVSTLASVAEVRRGLSWDREQESDDGVGVLAIPNIGQELDPVPRKFLSGVSEKDLERCAAETGDTLMIGSNGNPERVGQSVWVTGAQQCVVASFLMRIRSCSDLDPYLIFRHASQGRLVEHLRSGAVGSTGLRNLRVTAVRSAPILRATRGVEERFIEVTGPMRRLQDVLLHKNRVLEQARGLLLPLLISGKLDVSDLHLDLEPVA